MRSMRLAAAWQLAAIALLALALTAACADTGDDGRATTDDEPRDVPALRTQIGDLDTRITAIEERLAVIAAALGVDELDDLGEEMALLAEQIRDVSDLSAADLGIDPLYCIDPSDPEYNFAEFDVYVQGIAICGFLP